MVNLVLDHPTKYRVIYVHPHFEPVLGNTRNYFTVLSLDDIPHGCDLIAWAFFDIYNQDLEQIIADLRTRCRYLVVEINEFVDPKLIVLEQTLHGAWPQIQITGTAVPNYNSKMIFSGAWCTMSANPYSNSQLRPWAQEQMQRLVPAMTQKSRVFDCLLGTQRPHRDFIANRLSVSNLQDCFVFSYFRRHIGHGLWPESLDSQIVATGSKTHAADPHSAPLSVLLPTDIYNQTHYSIVAETTAYNDFSFYTEKIVKPLVAKRLFVVFAGRHYLANLRRMGFQTFGNVIDESYDEIACDYTRWESAWRQVERLCTQDPQSVLTEIQHIVEHNHHWFRGTDWYLSVRDHINSVLD